MNPSDFVLTNPQNSRIATLITSGTIRLGKVWDVATGESLWEHSYSYEPGQIQSIAPDFSPEGNYVAFHDGQSTITILNVETLPIVASRDIDIGDVYGNYKRFALGGMGESISILKAEPTSSRKHNRFRTRGTYIHVFETFGDVFEPDEDRRYIRYSNDGSQLILTRLSKRRSIQAFFGQHQDLNVDVYDFRSDKWQTSRRFNITESVLDISLLSGGLVNSDGKTLLALEYETISVLRRRVGQRSSREERLVVEMTMEGANEIRCMLSTHHNAFLSNGALVMVGPREGNEGGTRVRIWDNSSKDAPPSTYSVPTINYSTRLHRAVGFNGHQLALWLNDTTLSVVDVVPEE